MLTSLKLQNFKKHEDLEITFTAGLNVFRAPNENGKSSVYDAIRYAFWGARALPDSLEETVTWGSPVSSLKVTLHFSIATVPYKIVRSKSGAELTSIGLVVSGHSEVTAYVERITKASASVGMMTLLAPQGGLQDSLKSSAVELIEKLSNVELIDRLVTSVQANLPCGNTKLIDQQLESLRDLTAPVSDFSAEIAEIQCASISIEQLESTLATRQSKLVELTPLAKSASERAEAEQHRVKLLNSCELRLQRAQREVQWPVDEYVGPSIEEMEAALQAQRDDARIRAAWDVFTSLPVDYETGTTDALHVRMTELRTRLKLLAASGHAALVEAASLKASLITAASCNLCGKNLTDVPEVVEGNAKIRAKLHALQVQIDESAAEIKQLEQLEVSYQLLDNRDRIARRTLERITDFVTIDFSVMPPKATWKGPQVSLEKDTRNLEYMIRERRSDLEMFARQTGAAEAAVAQVNALREERARLLEPLTETEDARVLADFADIRSEIANLQTTLTAAKQQRTNLASDLKWKEEMHRLAMQAYQEKCTAREILQTQLQQYVSNNLLIKKLRETRPTVARELWNLVSSSVSHTFSKIRGVPSTVTRADDRFLIDGKSASVYSGSTKDSLGLAIRMVSQKIFLPNVDFMLLDEAASGADAVRETAMLSTLTTCGFPQVVLVTHSELADTFASNLIVI